jgi:uncharacterized protein with PIN domain
MEELYESLSLQNKAAKKTIIELLGIIKNYYGEKQIGDVIAELNDLKDDTYNQKEIKEVIELLSRNLNLCPICSNPLTIKTTYEIHTELDDNNIEKICGLYCEECGFDDSEE